VYGISMAPEDADVYPVYDESGHGTATADTVLQNAPNATIVMVEVSATSWSEIAEAIQWTAEQGWIDVVSASLGNIGNVPNPLVAGGDPDLEVPQASKAVVDSGKVYVNSAGNDPSPHYTDNADGPPWVVAVSGAEPTSQGRDVVPANGPDVVANFSVEAATHDSTSERDWIQGTSFSAPSWAKYSSSHQGCSGKCMYRGPGLAMRSREKIRFLASKVPTVYSGTFVRSRPFALRVGAETMGRPSPLMPLIANTRRRFLQ
jgi:hypothetical protein